ncbi:DUF4856 domain-containing protein [Dinghuibacter silviterrae]|uniref:Uncharacterized protein DUF4856 n=1 Tax=Dinghuibacter silviterrae TaxID=1539049 RepID=A0A4R8DQZ0_9BACT|nr:DUF4856 domain-containing protein [Dinghuibacter silviterrae]TDX00584.1 uncharacterized protein DUF4856 [Dinghuibacter silviterrae]
MKTHQAVLLIALILFGSCVKPNPIWSTYNPPATYVFNNVNDSAQVAVLDTLDNLSNNVNAANTSGRVVSAQVLQNILSHVSAYTSTAAAADLQAYTDSIALYSASTATASNGVAGRAGGYLFSPGGVVYGSLIQGTLISGILTYSIDRYLVDSVANGIDNSTVVPGYGTAMEHHWDEAFGLFGVPNGFPNYVQGVRYIGNFSNLIDKGQAFSTPLMTAFLTGRAAITHKDYGTKQTQVSAILAALEQLEAAAALHELNQADAAVASSQMQAAMADVSTALGFIRGLSYETVASRIITDVQIAQLETMVGYNLYNFVGNTTQESQVRALLGEVYGFTSTQMAAF